MSSVGSAIAVMDTSRLRRRPMRSPMWPGGGAVWGGGSDGGASWWAWGAFDRTQLLAASRCSIVQRREGAAGTGGWHCRLLPALTKHDCAEGPRHEPGREDAPELLKK